MRFLLPLSLIIPAVLSAQTPAASADAEAHFHRARQLAGDGDGAAGRAIVDSILATAPAGSERQAEALFWRATLAATVADAERDYRRVMVEFPLSPRAEESHLRLAQLELMRGNRKAAIEHLERLLMRYPATGVRANANYWMARILFEEGDIARACATVAAARSALSPGDVELRNQLEYTGSRCTAAAQPPARTAGTTGTTTAPSPSPPVSRPAPAPAAPASTTGGRYTIQVSAFDSAEPAEALRARLAAEGFDVRIYRADNLYRVRVGRYATRDDANAVAQRLTSRGLTTWITAFENR